MDDFAARLRRVLALAVVLPALALLPATAAAAGLPQQAAPEAHTHGPDGKSLDRRGQVAAETYEVDAPAPWTPSQYDGRALSADAADGTTLPTVHAIYLYPSDGANRFAQFAAMFQADARATADRLYGRAVRFDERLGGDGVTPYLDITVIRSKNTTKRLSGNRQYQMVRDELVAKGFNKPNKKYAVWLDAPSQYCGESQIYQDTQRTPANPNERTGIAIVYRPYATGDPTTGGFCRGRTLLHELGHNMGAVQTVAPNIYLSSGPHCDDSAEDVMCYRPPGVPDTGGPVFDYGTDDYWDPAASGTGLTTKLGWWTVNLSRFLCPTSGCASPNDPAY